MADPATTDEPTGHPPRRLDDPSVRERLAGLNDQLARLEGASGAIGELALSAVSGLAELYGEALARILDLAGPELVGRMVDDELVGHLLALHDIRPEPDRGVDGIRKAVSPQDAGAATRGPGRVTFVPVDSLMRPARSAGPR